MNVETTCVVPASGYRPLPAARSRHETLARPGIALSFKEGEQIYDQDDHADRVYRVIRGSVRASRLLADGRRQVGGFYYEGDLFGAEAGATRRYATEALDGGCQVAAICLGSSAVAKDAVERLVSQAAREELGRAQEHMSLLARTSASEKVATFLLTLATRFGPAWVHLPMGRQDMADYLGITIETISRTLGRLQADGVVEFGSCREFRVKRPDALERLALA